MRNLFFVLVTVLLIVALASPLACKSPARFQVVNIDVAPPEVVAGEVATVSAQVQNIGGTEGTYTVTLSVDGAKIESKVMKLASKTTETVSFTLTKDKPGSYNVEINDLSATFRVLKPAEFTFGNLLITPSIADLNQAITITADVSNTGEVEGRYPVTLIINGDKVETKELTVSPGATAKVSFAFAKDAAGSYSIEVGSLSGLIIVVEKGNILAQLSAAYPELYQELLKLPDLKELDDKDNEAIEDIVGLALNPIYKGAFESILNEGIKEKRKYCTPLQALLWIAYDREFDADNPLQDYSLRRLMNNAWRNTTTSKNYTSVRWQDFDEVVDRLNSPRLVSIYMVDNIAYDYEELENINRHINPRFAPPKDTFLRKKGVCNEQARFALYCLLNNGYDYDDFDTKENATCMLGIDIDTWQGHDVCLFKEGNVFYTIDNGVLRGPFPSVVDAVDSTATRVNIATWGKYFFRDLNLNVTKVVRAEEAVRPPAEAKGKGIFIDGVTDEWPSDIAMISDPAGDVSSGAQDKRGVDLKAVRTFMDENYLYVAIQIYDVFETSLLRNYFVALDFDGDKQDEYHFGFRPNGDTWVFDHTKDKNNWNAEDTWDVLALGKQDTIEMMISRKEYRIPLDILIYCRVTEGGPTVDKTEWLRVPLITTISGIAFHDFNGNGTWEADEPLIQSVKLEFVNNTNTEKVCENTGVDGRYSLRLPAGSYTLRILAKDTVGYNNQPYRYMSVSKSEFKSLSSPMNININSDLEFNIPLMQGYLTLPFPKGTIETGQRVYVSINPEGDIGRDWRGVLYVRADHLGTDFLLPTNTPILAAAPGVVVESRWSDDDGNLISIRHPDGNLTIYCHLETRDVYPGNSVSRGDKIGTSGNTGKLVGPNPHLHFQFGSYGRDRIDPYRDITSPSSVSWWTVDNDPQYP